MSGEWTPKRGQKNKKRKRRSDRDCGEEQNKGYGVIYLMINPFMSCHPSYFVFHIPLQPSRATVMITS